MVYTCNPTNPYTYTRLLRTRPLHWHTYIHTYIPSARVPSECDYVGGYVCVFVWLRVSKMEISAVVPPPPQLPQRRGASRTRFNAHHMQHTYASQQPARKCARSLALSHSPAFNVTRACQAPGPSPSRCGRDGPFRRFVTLSAGVQRIPVLSAFACAPSAVLLDTRIGFGHCTLICVAVRDEFGPTKPAGSHRMRTAQPGNVVPSLERRDRTFVKTEHVSTRSLHPIYPSGRIVTYLCKTLSKPE